MTELKIVNKKSWMLKGFGLYFVSSVTDKDDLIKGFSLFLFNKQVFTIAFCSDGWEDDEGKKYVLQLDDNILFAGKFALAKRL